LSFKAYNCPAATDSRTTIDNMSLIEEKNLKVIAFSRKQEEWKF